MSTGFWFISETTEILDTRAPLLYILNAMPDARRDPLAGKSLTSLHCAVVAQVVERILGKDEVRQFESAQQLQRSNA